LPKLKEENMEVRFQKIVQKLFESLQKFYNYQKINFALEFLVTDFDKYRNFFISFIRNVRVIFGFLYIK
jgi:hypothetical protein